MLFIFVCLLHFVHMSLMLMCIRPPSDFERVTTKYWVRADSALDVKLYLLQHLPVLVFDDAKADERVKVDSFPADSSWISSVYLDSRTGYSYHKRIKREEGARLVRVRSYSANPLEASTLFGAFWMLVVDCRFSSLMLIKRTRSGTQNASRVVGERAECEAAVCARRSAHGRVSARSA